MSDFQQYRFTTAGGKRTLDFVRKGDLGHLKAKMREHAATKAEPVAPPPCVKCSGPVCPIIDFEEK